MHLTIIRPLALSLLLASSNSVWAALLDSGAVASPDKYGAQAAADILKLGRNAVDAEWQQTYLAMFTETGL